jgi:hypothetical protein
MREEYTTVCRESIFWAVAVIFLGVVVGASAASAQFGLKLPRIPKLGKKETEPTTPSRAKKPRVPAPEITSITPDSAPPGGEGELVLTGKNLFPGMVLNLCGTLTKLEVQSPERAVAHIKIGEAVEEGPCETTAVYGIGNDGEILPAGETTPEVHQQQRVSFSISNSSPLPVAFGMYNLMPEEEIKLAVAMEARGQKIRRSQEQLEKDQDAQKLVQEARKAGKEKDLQKMMELAAQMQQTGAVQEMQQQTPQMLADTQRLNELQKQVKLGKLLLEAGSLKFVAENATIFTEPASAVKQIAYLNMGEASKGVFRIAFSDGKSYCFKETEDNQNGVERVKKRLGK